MNCCGNFCYNLCHLKFQMMNQERLQRELALDALDRRDRKDWDENREHAAQVTARKKELFERSGFVGHLFSLSSGEQMEEYRLFIGKLEAMGIDYHIFEQDGCKLIYAAPDRIDEIGLSIRYRIRTTLG